MKTRFTSIFSRAAIVLLLVIFAPPTEAWADFSWDGDGTSSAPYQIDTYEKLKEFAAIVNGTSSVSSSNSLACAKLTADILCNDQDWTPIGGNLQPYAGTFDGDGHTITGLSNSSNSSDYAGLFGYVGSQGVVRNVTLVNATITGKNVGAIVKTQ